MDIDDNSSLLQRSISIQEIDLMPLLADMLDRIQTLAVAVSHFFIETYFQFNNKDYGWSGIPCSISRCCSEASLAADMSGHLFF